MTADLDDLRELLDDFSTELRQRNRAPRTIDHYSRDVLYFVDYLEENQIPATATSFNRNRLGKYIEHLLTKTSARTGRPLEPSYVNGQYRSLQQFGKYLAAEEIIPTDPFAR